LVVATVLCASGAAAQNLPRCPNPIAVERASDTASANSAVANAAVDPACTGRPAQEIIREAAKTLSGPPGVVVVAAGGFTGALMSRLDGAQEQAAVDVGGGGPMGLGVKTKSQQRSQPIAPSSAVSVYAMGTFAGGHRSDLPDAVGLDYHVKAGTVGMEYRATRNLILGLAGNVVTGSADLNNGAGVDVAALQMAIYLSYATKLWFADGLMSYGRFDLDTVRPGQNPGSPVLGSTGGDGYLLDLGGVRAGPIAGLSFSRTRVSGFTEIGDQALQVGSQAVDSVVGSAGVRFLAPFVAEGNVVIPYLNVTLEHQFGEAAHSVSVSLAAAGDSPILVAAPNFETRTYGKVEGGVTLHLSPDLSASISGATTFARGEGNDHRLTTGLTYKF
jgi:uncharacterized protein YhjY with autotransporter beta-barrel domain